jgi:hypothetical protein
LYLFNLLSSKNEIQELLQEKEDEINQIKQELEGIDS